HAHTFLLDGLGFAGLFGPDRLRGSGLRQEPIRVLDEIAQNVKGFRRQRQALVAAPQPVIHRVQPEWVEELHGSTVTKSEPITSPLRHPSGSSRFYARIVSDDPNVKGGRHVKTPSRIGRMTFAGVVVA